MNICAVIVTYNRKELLLRCVKKCFEQSLALDVIVFDNASIDGTEQLLMKNNILESSRLKYYKATENLGGAGGFYEGLKIAYDLGYDYIWLMDDDGYPENEYTLEEAVGFFKDNKYLIVNSLILSAEGGESLSFATGGHKNKNDAWIHYPDGKMWGSISPFNGTLISQEVVSKIGFPRRDFFIKGDEAEYIYRALKNNIKVVTALKSEYRHPTMNDYSINILGYKFKYSEESYWKEYYKARNYVYVYKKYFSKRQLIKHYIYTLLKCFVIQEDCKRKRKYMLKGLIDGTKNRFGKIVVP